MAEEAGLYRAGADERAVTAGAARAPAEPSASPSASRSLPGARRVSGVLWASATTRPSVRCGMPQDQAGSPVPAVGRGTGLGRRGRQLGPVQPAAGADAGSGRGRERGH